MRQVAPLQERLREMNRTADLARLRARMLDIRTAVSGLQEPLERMCEISQERERLLAAVAPLRVRVDVVRMLEGPGLQELARMGELAASYQERFRMPLADEIARVVEAVQGRGLAQVVENARRRGAQLQQVLDGLQQPWIDAQHIARSVEGMAGLQAIGEALKARTPFEETVSDVLRGALGDWRGMALGRLAALDDLSERMEVYEELGFKGALTSFPEPTFEESLLVTGIRTPVWPQVAGDEEEEAPGDKKEIERSTRAYGRIVKLERHLRGFVAARMESACGKDWERQRVPGDVRGEWNDRRDRALQDGRPKEALIEYSEIGDFIKIIGRKDNWGAVFRDVFGHKDEIEMSLKRLIPVRRDTMHARFITLDDELLLEVEATRILKAMGLL